MANLANYKHGTSQNLKVSEELQPTLLQLIGFKTYFRSRKQYTRFVIIIIFLN